MDKDERIYVVLANYTYISEYLGDIIEDRFKMPYFENNILISRILKAAETLSADPLYEDTIHQKSGFSNNDEFYDDESYDDEFYKEKRLAKNVPGLYSLDKALFYGKKYCREFENIFFNVSFKKYGEADFKILNILSQVKCLEFLSKSEFRDIAAVDKSKDQAQIDFIARIPPSVDYFAIAVTRFLTIEDISRYDKRHIMNFVSSNISNAIREKSPKIEHFCKSNVGVNKGIIFISSGHEYFYKLFNLSPSKFRVILNKEWQKYNAINTNRYLKNLVVMTDRNVRNAIVYPSLN